MLGLRKIREIPDDGVAGAKILFALPDGRFFGLVQHAAGELAHRPRRTHPERD